MLQRAWPWAGGAVLLGLAWLAYSPGLSGGFLFDDFVNLDALGATGRVDDWPTFWRYLTSGTADPIGRPLSLLTFLIDARDWPADPQPFLRTNVILHLFNAVLLFGLVRKLEGLLETTPTRRLAVALVATSMWLLHPLFVSTTLYVVQREAMLPATFTIMGLLCWCHGRETRSPQAALLWMLIGAVVFTPLAMLSKANGILLPLLILALEFTVLRAAPNAAHTSSISARLVPLLAIPALVVIGYLLLQVRHLGDVPAGRDWTLWERLLTQPRVLLDYLGLLVVPRSISTGIYNDGYLVSTGLLAPASTLPALLAILAFAIVPVFARSQSPRLSAALAFFFVAHLLESTTVPLELYFEHRNYLPAILLFWPLGWLICSRLRPGLAFAASALLILILSWTTFQRASLWGEPARLSQLWARFSPNSSRAQATWAMHLVASGRAEEASKHLAPLWAAHRDDLQLAFNYVDSACKSKGLSAREAAQVSESLARFHRGDALAAKWLAGAIEVGRRGECAGLDLDTARAWVNSASKNPLFSKQGKPGVAIELLRSDLALAENQPAIAAVYLLRVLRLSPSPETAARNASILASAGRYDLALQQLDTYDRLPSIPMRDGIGMATVHEWILERQRYWQHEHQDLRRRLKSALESETPGARN